jgi:hypothetical protein
VRGKVGEWRWGREKWKWRRNWKDLQRTSEVSDSSTRYFRRMRVAMLALGPALVGL